jgi:poly(3-hydroxyalkanoate) synthetase
VANDIGAAVTHVREMTGSGPVDLIGASSGGGISAFFTARLPSQVRRRPAARTTTKGPSPATSERVGYFQDG